MDLVRIEPTTSIACQDLNNTISLYKRRGWPFELSLPAVLISELESPDLRARRGEAQPQQCNQEGEGGSEIEGSAPAKTLHGPGDQRRRDCRTNGGPMSISELRIHGV